MLKKTNYYINNIYCKELVSTIKKVFLVLLFYNFSLFCASSAETSIEKSNTFSVNPYKKKYYFTNNNFNFEDIKSKFSEESFLKELKNTREMEGFPFGLPQLISQYAALGSDDSTLCSYNGFYLIDKIDSYVRSLKVLGEKYSKYPKLWEKLRNAKKELHEDIMKKVKEILQYPININVQGGSGGYYGDTSLILAVRSNDKELVQLLLDNGADVKLSCSYGANALAESVLSFVNADIFFMILNMSCGETRKEALDQIKKKGELKYRTRYEGYIKHIK